MCRRLVIRGQLAAARPRGASSGATNAAAGLPGAYLYELVVHCKPWGAEPDAILAGTGLTLDALKDPGTRVPLAACDTLVDRARTLTGQPGLAFLLGLHMRLSWHGFLGFAAMAAGTVREALEIAEQFSLTRTAAFTLSTHVEGSVASLVLEDRLPAGPLREFAVIALLVGISRIAREVTGKTLAGVAECAFPEPPYAAPLLEQARGFLPGTMRFGQPVHRLVFDASILELPLVNADPAAMALARAQCDRELAALSEETGLLGRVKKEVSRGEGPGFASLETVARRLGASTRTLKRRLAEQGTTYTEAPRRAAKAESPAPAR